MKNRQDHHPSPFLTSIPAGYVAWCPGEGFYVNLAGLYNYLELPYYISQDYEHSNRPIHPTCAEMLDAYISPLLLEKAKLNGLDIPDYYISNGYFEPPVVIDPINPFTIKSRVILKNGRENSIGKSMTRNFTYAICCQEIPPRSRVVYTRAVLGWSLSRQFREISRLIWEHFRIPLAKIRLIVKPDNKILLSDISPLPLESLGSKERKYLEEHVQWEK
ncbi:MAG: hypothetical protein ABIK68_00865 [bacterium]